MLCDTRSDADRLAVAEKQRDGSWRIFNGNEIGSLFASWLWQSWCREHPDGDRSMSVAGSNAVPLSYPGKCAMLTTNVSSRLIKAMADVEGFHVCSGDALCVGAFMLFSSKRR